MNINNCFWGERVVKLVIFSLFIMGSSLSFASPMPSAYSKLRTQFLQAYQPSSEELNVDLIWYCSDSLEASKKQIRQVQIWHPKIEFVSREEVLIYDVGEKKELIQNPLRVV